MRANLQTTLNAIGLAGMLVLLAAIGYFGVIEKPFLSYGNLPFPVLTSHIKPGQAVQLEVLRCNSDDRSRVYIIARTLVPVDPSRSPYVLPSGSASISPGCTTSVSAVNVIPLGVPPGRYWIQGSAEVNGSIRTFVVGWRSNPFEVVVD